MTKFFSAKFIGVWEWEGKPLGEPKSFPNRRFYDLPKNLARQEARPPTRPASPSLVPLIIQHDADMLCDEVFLQPFPSAFKPET
jgi:hypothetical protein